MTLIEMLIVIAIVIILAGIAMEHYQGAKIRANVALSEANVKNMVYGLESYHLDNGEYPVPRPMIPADPHGVVARSALPGLTTPIAYLSSQGFTDPFGAIQMQGSTSERDMYGFAKPSFNPARSLLYFHYPSFAAQVYKPALARNGYAVISLGPDQKDSFGVYRPFANFLPASAAQYGITSIQDTVYDPTNGLISGGDIVTCGGDLSALRK